MSDQMFAVRITAQGEVRDKDGKLIETVPIDTTLTLTAEQVQDLGLVPPGDPS